jgi:hypothetical protein
VEQQGGKEHKINQTFGTLKEVGRKIQLVKKRPAKSNEQEVWYNEQYD